MTGAFRFKRALMWGFFLWIVGLAWGTVVFSIAPLKDLPTISYVSKYPAISGVLLFVYLALIVYISSRELKSGNGSDGLKLGLTISVSNFLLDLIVYFLLLGSSDYFAYGSIWISYAAFLAIPWLTSRRKEAGRL